MGTGLILALDFGGTKLSAATLEPGKTTWRSIRRIFSQPGADAEYDRQAMFALAHELLSREQPIAIGVSFGGPVDYPTGTVRLSHHVPGWENIPLKAILETEFNANAYVDNDANVAALGEHRFGAGRGFSDICYITVSTGVGGGWILNGQPWRGADGMAGEIGHMVVDLNGPLCLCGKRGCVERLASGPYMAEDARAELATRSGVPALPGEGGVLFSLAEGNPVRVTAKLIAEAAAQGDRFAWKFLQRSAWALGVGIGNAANLINPQRFILGGGVTKSGEWFWQEVRRVARSTALPEVKFDVVPAELGDDAPLWGAVALTNRF
ncbi:MAG TPA: ROK family protein [Anaerolineales bacterium]|nr:ROK family protein [Anaerolineales bacterium]